MGSSTKRSNAFKWLQSYYQGFTRSRRQETVASKVQGKPLSLNKTAPRPLTPLATKFVNFKVLNTIVKQAIELEIDKQVAEHQQFLQLGLAKIKLMQKALALEEEKRAKKKKWHDQFSFYLNLYFIVAALMMSSGVVGVVIGLNVPEAIACRGQDTPCWHLRFRNQKNTF